MKDKLKAILIDSGRVLNGPVTGHWMITPNFFNYVDKKKLNSIHKIRKNQAFQKALDYISKHTLIETEEDECVHFYEHYRIFSNELPELELSEGKIELITKDLVYNYDKY